MRHAFCLIRAERERQERLKQEGRFRYTLLDTGIQESEKLACIVEEVGEVGRNVLARAHLVFDGDLEDTALLSELTQVAALACAWMERLVSTQQEDKGGAEKDRRDPHMPRRREYRTGAELTKMGIADRREYLRRKDDRLHRSA